MRTYLIEAQSIFVPYLRRMLSDAGCDVIATNHGIDGRDITAHDPAAIFVDVDFLERGATTALCRIRDVARSARVIALSESSDALFAATCVISGANAVFSKSANAEQLVSALREAVAAT